MAGLLDFMTNQDPSARERRLRLAQGLAGMTLRPNTGLQQSIATQLQGIQQQRQANKTIQALSAAGVPAEVLQVARLNPALTKDITASYLKAKMGTGYMPKFSGVQTDPNTGQQYIVKSDPNTGQATRINVEGAVAMTPAAKAALETKTTIEAQDIAKAQEVGQQAFGRAGVVDEMITKLSRARNAIVEGGAATGLIAQYLPAFDSATAELRSMANQLGIDIINSATFGALSEKELSLALSTGLPVGLPGDELVKHIDSKIAAQRKLREELMTKARRLTQGQTTYSSYIAEEVEKMQQRTTPIPTYQQQTQAQPAGKQIRFTEEQWQRMSPEQRALFEQFMK